MHEDPDETNLDLWRSIWRVYDDYDWEGVEVVWTKGHAKEKAGETVQEKRHRHGNSMADKAADWGSELHSVPKGTVKEVKQWHKGAIRWASYIAARHQQISQGDSDVPPRREDERGGY